MPTERYVYSLKDGDGEKRLLLGGKGANLCKMAQSGLPVPAGFILTTEVCRKYMQDPKIMDEVWDDVKKSVAQLEKETGKGFNDGKNPLLVSVRSGAPISMPGMMETILNLGLNDETVKGLAESSGNKRFAYDSYRRFIQMFSSVVDEVNFDLFEAALAATRKAAGVEQDYQIPAEALEKLLVEYKAIYKKATGNDFPSDPWVQLRRAIEAVFKSWNIPRAVTYRKINKIDDNLGTAVNVIAMIFGNLGDDCGTGVCFTRNPSTGENKLYGEFLINAQGEDVVAGIRTPMPIAELEQKMPEIYKELCRLTSHLEKTYHEMQDIEFTIERGKLFLLQTRAGKRTASAAVKVAVDMVNEGLIDTKTAVTRVSPEQVEMLLHRQVDKSAKQDVITKGLPASPGAGAGMLVFSADEAEEWARTGKPVILARPETSPDDIHGLFASQGVVTSRGGMTSHAAVVARGMGKPAVCGCEEAVIDVDKETLTVGDRVFKKGDWVTVDGTTGNFLAGEAKMVDATFTEDFKKILEWADENAKLKVWTNADTPEDAKRAREFGAKGVGLCRTEHMFMGVDRLPVMQRLIVALTGSAEGKEGRKDALAKLKVMQKDDFTGIFKAMDGLPVIIRLLDPPLHEFLPKEPNILEALKTATPEEAKKLNETLERVHQLHENNPMLGFRGCRLGMIYPEIYEMQMSAIFEAVVDLTKGGVTVKPEVMIPLVGTKPEMKFFREMADRIAAEVMKESGVKFNYLVGTMIEVPRAALVADQLAEYAQFFSCGTNDLTQTTLGYSRDDAENKFLFQYIDKGVFKENPFAELDRDGPGQLVKMAVEKGRSVNPGLSVGICGEHGGNPASIAFCHSVNLNYVSCSPFRVPVARIAAAHAALGVLK
ncbi:MAG: pyruvate, phosphate dikinase [Synergistales bacterium]|nr:pyruvate, phosphate dikinase [Synergistales bacterium]MDY6401087.1 pyruvate, phosphate dikinase [Synergistales bacterium]MDY6404680.1 pyruvate, phosphate dikinase [Synergistales bacterium]MDY6410904.1 pyruvate, phosphate dikinase [Synergistales bacterium]MDY6415125.1 pyruvate, phosphate dikinase [Synergistales bacterium]